MKKGIPKFKNTILIKSREEEGNKFQINFERFEKAFSSLAHLYKKEGFYKAPNAFETNLYAKFLDYEYELKIIISRLEDEIKEFDSSYKKIFQLVCSGREPNLTETKTMIMSLSKIKLDLSDFYVYTRSFLDTLNVCIKQSFKITGNKNWKLMKNSINGILNEQKMLTYEEKIDSKFFQGLKEHVSWVCSLRESRGDLLHSFHYFTFTYTKHDEYGYDIVGKIDQIWGTETVKPILAELQKFIDELSDLMEYLNKKLPRIQSGTCC